MGEVLEWVGTGGGPLIVIPAEIAPHWRGGEGISVSPEDHHRWWEKLDPSGSDYGRACGIGDFIGTLEVGPGRALILNDENMPTAFVRKAQGGIFVRWMWADDEDEVRRAISNIPDSATMTTPHSIAVGLGGLLIFDSAYPGDDLPTTPGDGGTVPWLRLELPPGRYDVETADYSPNDSTRLILHRLRRK